MRLTRNHIASVHRIFIFDESKAIHELDLGDLPCAMSVEVGFDIRLRRCVTVSLEPHFGHQDLSGCMRQRSYAVA